MGDRDRDRDRDRDDAELHAEIDGLVATHRERIRELQASFAQMNDESQRSHAALETSYREERSAWEAERAALASQMATMEALSASQKETLEALRTSLSSSRHELMQANQAIAGLEKEVDSLREALVDAEAKAAAAAAAGAGAGAHADGDASRQQEGELRASHDREAAAVERAEEAERRLGRAMARIELLEETVRSECEERIGLKAQIKMLKAQLRSSKS